MYATSSIAHAMDATNTGRRARRTGADAALQRLRSSATVPHVMTTHPAKNGTLRSSTASGADPSASIESGQCGAHCISGVLTGGCSLSRNTASQDNATAPPVNHRNRRSMALMCPVGCASIRNANSVGAKPAPRSPIVNRNRSAEPLRSHSDEYNPTATSSPPIRA
jgi:hypothetical protein